MTGFSTLSLREKLLLVGGGVLLAALMVWQFVWVPIAQERADLDEDITRYVLLAQVADEVGTGAGTGSDAQPSIPLAQRVTRSADASGVALARLAPEGNRLRIVVERTQFNDLLSWIEMLEGVEGTRVLALDIERLTEPGLVTARLNVEALE